MKLKKLNCDNTQKSNFDKPQTVKKLNNSECDKTHILTKLKIANCDQTQNSKGRSSGQRQF